MHSELQSMALHGMRNPPVRPCAAYAAPHALAGHPRKRGGGLGVRLVDTCGKRLVHTEAARVLLEGADEVFRAFERCENTLKAVRVGAPAREHM